jgi:hypothetical protein
MCIILENISPKISHLFRIKFDVYHLQLLYSRLLKIKTFLFFKGRNTSFNETHINELKAVEFRSRIIMTSQCAKKILMDPTTFLHCLQTGTCLTSSKQPY